MPSVGHLVAPLVCAILSLSLSACNSGGSSSSSGGQVTVSSTLTGVAQKGPMPAATLMVYKLNNNGLRSGESASSTTDANGRYEVNVPWEGPSEVVVDGFYTDDLTGSISSNSVSLRAFTVLSGNTVTVCNLNLFMHLATARAGELLVIDPNADFFSALSGASAEVITAFGLTGDTPLEILDLTDGRGSQSANNAQLLLLSAAIAKHVSNHPGITAAQLLSNLSGDLQDDGSINGIGFTTLAELGTTASTINLDTDIALTGTDLPNSGDLARAPSWVNHAPVASLITPQSTDEDTPSSPITLTVSDSDGDNLQVTVIAGPSNGSLNLSAGAAPLNVVYTPNANYNGNDNFSYRVSDGKATSATVTVDLTINPVNDAPLATPLTTVNTHEDTASAAFNLTGTDVDGDTLSVAIVTQPAHGALSFSGSAAPLAVVYTPAANFNGADSLQFRVSDNHGGQSDPVTVNIAVAPVNDAPVFPTIANQNATQGQAFSVTINATDVDGDTLSYSVTGTALPAWASLNTASGEISGTPDTVATTSGIEISANDGTLTVASNSFDLTVAPATFNGIRRVSVASAGTQGNADSYVRGSSISADGRFVAFWSDASNLVANDTNSRSDVFVHDTQNRTTRRVSVASDGTQGGGVSTHAVISANGRYVAFLSTSNNLVANDTNGQSDIFVHDLQTSTTSRVSLASDGSQANNASDGEITLSADGRYIAFSSEASNLVAGDSNAAGDVFVRDTLNGTTSRVSVASGGTQSDGSSVRPQISSDGRYIAFESIATNLVPGDSNGASDIFVHDTQSGITSQISVASDATPGNLSSTLPSMSANGRYVIFKSQANNLVAGDSNGRDDIFIRDTQAGTTGRVSVAPDGSQLALESNFGVISPDGRYGAFYSFATNLVPNDTNGKADLFVRDLQSGATARINIATDGTSSEDGFALPYMSFSGDGRYVGFASPSTNLVLNDTNGVNDAFLADSPVWSAP